MRNSFSLEQAYRDGFAPDLYDLSSSAPLAPDLISLFPDEPSTGRYLSTLLTYGPGGGEPALRAAIAARYPGLEPENILVTAGGLEAIRAAAMGLIEPGDRVVVQAPTYDALTQAVLDQNASLMPIRAGADMIFDLRQSGSAEVAFLNSPSGIGGGLVQGLDGFAGRLIVDEVYRPITPLTGMEPRSVVDLSPTAVAIGDLSKPLGLGGLRIGWLASRDLAAIRRCADALDYLSGSVSVLSSAAALAALEHFDEILLGHTMRARRNLTRWAAFAERHDPWLDWAVPQSGFTISVRLKNGPLPSRAFERLRQAGVFLLPGEAIGWPDHLRIGTGGDEMGFARSLDLLGAELRRLEPKAVDRSGEVILLTKVPVPGFGKSRIASSIGTEAAYQLATAFLQDTIEACRSRADRLFIAAAPAEACAELSSAAGNAVVFAQPNGTLGERLEAAFAEVFARGATNPVLIGSDSPTLPGSLLRLASHALEMNDVVLGPADDGGYYAIGLRANQPALFASINWSTSRVLEQTLERCREHGLRVHLLPYWYDVDSADDLRRLRTDPLLRPATAEVLARIP